MEYTPEYLRDLRKNTPSMQDFMLSMQKDIEVCMFKQSQYDCNYLYYDLTRLNFSGEIVDAVVNLFRNNRFTVQHEAGKQLIISWV